MAIHEIECATYVNQKRDLRKTQGLQYHVMAYTLWGCIESHLSNADKNSLRLACEQFNNAVSLRPNRVFLPANPLNIVVFCNIASHNKFRHQVNEIIWDEARLYWGPLRMAQSMEGHDYLSDEAEPDNNREWAAEDWRRHWPEEHGQRHWMISPTSVSLKRDGCPTWSKNACENNSLIDILADQSDLKAFAFGVKQFPALKRVTNTPAAHDTLVTSLYSTLMIRAFPKGFNHPFLVVGCGPEKSKRPLLHTQLRDRYRGFRTARNVRANDPNSVSELAMTSNSIPTRINCTIFDEPCEEYNHFATVLKKPGFRRLDDALLGGGEREEISKHVGDLCSMGACAGHLAKPKKWKSPGCAQDWSTCTSSTMRNHSY
ncbi:hypothetical protein N7535_004498 [Penicillium sp. DV-2018c]|nr:hypothetical protein N7535_004498 [Penicillium sp. DV-2018c]